MDVPHCRSSSVDQRRCAAAGAAILRCEPHHAFADLDGRVAAAPKAPEVPTTVIVDRKDLIEERVERTVRRKAPASIALVRQMVGPAE
jgi:hypothetical protein